MTGKSLVVVAAIAFVVLSPTGPAFAQTLGVMAGTVEDDRGRPVPAARLTLTGPELRGTRSTMTDDRGRFTFVGVPAGRFAMTAQKAGHVRVQYGARAPGGPGVPIVLAAGQHLDKLIVRLPRGGVITGTIMDPDGAPAAGVAVRALRVVTQNGERQLMQVGGDSTDDRGAYRIFQLPPGDYVVSATPRDTEAENVSAYAPVYYPGTNVFVSAMRVRLAISEERQGVDIPLQLQPVVTVAGAITSAPAALDCESTVALVPMTAVDMPSPGEVATVEVDDGRFEFTEVAPGPYRLLARCGGASASARSPGPLWAAREIAVGASDIRDAVLTLRPGMTVSGRMVFDAATSATPNAGRVRLSLTERGVAAGELSAGTHVARVTPDGRFVVSGLPPGRYDIDASVSSTDAGDWRLDSAIVGGRDALDVPLEVPSDAHVTDVLLTFTRRTQGVAGRVVDQMGQPMTDYTIVAFHADRRYWLPGSRRVKTARVGTDGTFAIADLPPGDYRLAAVDDVRLTAWDDPDALEPLVRSSVPVTVTRGTQASQQLRVTR